MNDPDIMDYFAIKTYTTLIARSNGLTLDTHRVLIRDSLILSKIYYEEREKMLEEIEKEETEKERETLKQITESNEKHTNKAGSGDTAIHRGNRPYRKKVYKRKYERPKTRPEEQDPI